RVGRGGEADQGALRRGRAVGWIGPLARAVGPPRSRISRRRGLRDAWRLPHRHGGAGPSSRVAGGLGRPHLHREAGGRPPRAEGRDRPETGEQAGRQAGEGRSPAREGALVSHSSDLRSLSLEELGVLVERMGERPFRARQLFRWIHHKGAASLGEMTDLPRPFRERLARETGLTTLAVDAVQRSADGTRKYRMRTEDGKLIEAVYMPEEPGPDAFDPEADEEEEPGRKRVRRTLCVSTQVGCAMGCAFCMTATMGLVRHLTPGE